MNASLRKLAREKIYWHSTRIINFPGFLINYLFATTYYDLVTSRRKKVYAGRRERGSRVAIFLTFPQFGLKPSHINTLTYLLRKGYAPIVVSNLQFSEPERSSILDNCWKLIERPNFGYDFGGYREAILSLGADLAALDRLVLVNDSSWFPLPETSDWLDDVEAMGVDFAGAASNLGVDGPEPSDFRSMVWNNQSTLPNFHYCSFALCIAGPVLRDPAFRRFWQRFSLTNDKFLTVRRGEVGLTQWVMTRSFSHGATLNIQRLDLDLAACLPQRLREVTRETIIAECPELRAIKKGVLARYDGSDAWCEEARRFILTAVARAGVSYVLSEFIIHERGFPFLKKSPIWLNEESSDSTIRIAQRLTGSQGEAILEEALDLRRRRASSFKPLLTQANFD